MTISKKIISLGKVMYFSVTSVTEHAKKASNPYWHSVTLKLHIFTNFSHFDAFQLYKRVEFCYLI